MLLTIGQAAATPEKKAPSKSSSGILKLGYSRPLALECYHGGKEEDSSKTHIMQTEKCVMVQIYWTNDNNKKYNGIINRG